MKNLLIIYLAFFIFLSVSGQDNKKWNFQLNGGTTLTIPFEKSTEKDFEYNGQIIDKEKINYLSGFGYFAEFMTSYTLNSKLSFLIGVNYSNTSFKFNSELGLQNNIGTITSSNIHFPLFVKYKMIEKIPISISFGPYLKILTTANQEGTVYLDTTNLIVADPNDPLLQPEMDYSEDIKSNFEKIDYGLSLQLNYEITLSKKMTGIILTRFNYGLRNVINNQSAKVNIPEQWKNYNFDIGIGIKI